MPKEERKISSKEPTSKLTLCLKELEKKETTELKVRRRKEIIMIRAEIDEIDNRKPIERINQTKSLFFGR